MDIWRIQHSDEGSEISAVEIIEPEHEHEHEEMMEEVEEEALLRGRSQENELNDAEERAGATQTGNPSRRRRRRHGVMRRNPPHPSPNPSEAPRCPTRALIGRLLVASSIALNVLLVALFFVFFHRHRRHLPAPAACELLGGPMQQQQRQRQYQKASRSADSSSSRGNNHPQSSSLALPSPDDDGGGNKSQSMVFHHDPTIFIDRFVDCLDDGDCSVYYHHVQKTGGSYLSSRLHPALMDGAEYRNRDSCCFGRMMDRFHNDTGRYCRMKFSVWEVGSLDVNEVVSHCMTERRKRGQRPRAVLLRTVREPIRRTLSLINMHCNTFYRKHSARLEGACDRCSYNLDREVWDGYVNSTNELYDEIAATSTSKGLADVSNNVDILTMDMTNINDFFELLQTKLVGTIIPRGPSNVEHLSICNFGVSSSMMRHLAPSEAAYRNLLWPR